MTPKRTITTGLVLMLATACGGGSAEPSDGAAPAASATSAASAASPQSPPTRLDAAQVVERLKAGGVPVASTLVITEANDPNKLLGRPNGYVSKVELVDSRVPVADRGTPGNVDDGASVEVFADAERAAARAAFIQGIAKTSPALANEYDYVKGTVLVRVTGNLTPTQAAPYKAVVEALPA